MEIRMKWKWGRSGHGDGGWGSNEWNGDKNGHRVAMGAG